MLNSQNHTSTNVSDISEIKQKIAIREKSNFLPY